MAGDNILLATIGVKAASREVSYSGETAQVQAVGLVTFDGPDDAKAVADVGRDNPLPVSAEAVEWLLGQIVGLLTSPAGFVRNQARARVTAILESGTVTAVTTVAAVTALNNFGSLPAEAVARHQNLAAWQLCQGSTIS